MDFWSKGLGKRTVSVDLAKSEAVKSDDVLYLKGTMEEPITWDYIMRLRADDMVEFMGLLRDPRVADYIYDSPNRWRLYARLLLGGVRLLWLVVVAVVRGRFGRGGVDGPHIELPPPIERRRPVARQRKSRRRLTSTEARLSVIGERPAQRQAQTGGQTEAVSARPATPSR
ncbi:MAG: hypothetical protein DYH08_05595 [Actinobacteria bacterium ATB1]|nr:hypothetical protein [Actinobacteria bacterium ATB1]